MPMGTQLMEWQPFRLPRQNWWGWGPQASQPTHSLERKRETRRVSYYFLSNCFCTIYFFKAQMLFSYSFSLPWCLTLSASQQKPERKTRNWAGQGGGWGTKGPGEPGSREKELAERGPSRGHSSSRRCNCRVLLSAQRCISPIQMVALCHQY